MCLFLFGAWEWANLGHARLKNIGRRQKWSPGKLRAYLFFYISSFLYVSVFFVNFFHYYCFRLVSLLDDLNTACTQKQSFGVTHTHTRALTSRTTFIGMRSVSFDNVRPHYIQPGCSFYRYRTHPSSAPTDGPMDRCASAIWWKDTGRGIDPHPERGCVRAII